MLETIFNVLKISVVVAICAVFMVAIINLLNLITSVVFGNIIGEILSLISMFLPFNADIVFGSLGISISAIFAFLIAKKIFDLTSWSVSTV